MITSLGDRRFSCRDIVLVAQNGNQLALSAGSLARISAGRAIVEQMAAGSEPIYGVNTGLGGNLRHRIPAGDIEDFQTQIIFGRMIGVGPALDPVICRAILLCRLIELASGATGVSLDTIQLLVELFNRGVTPVIPSLGSISASDIGALAHLAAVVIGHGEAWFNGERMSGGAALAAAGLQPARLREKDGIGLINHAAASATLAAYAVCDLEDALLVATAVAALSYEGYAANPAILDARLHAARPAGGQEEAAGMMRRALAGSSIHEPGQARYLQDVLSFRLLAPALGTTLAALATARRESEIEINGVVVTPMIFIDDKEILSSPNFHTPSLSLAFDTLAISLTHFASLSAFRLSKLMTAAFSGLPQYLSPVGGGSAGYVSLQKTTSALYCDIRSLAMPVSLDALPVSDTVEDVASYAMQAIAKLQRQMERFRYLSAIEALAAAQAVDLRGAPRLGVATSCLHQAIRHVVPPLQADRPPGADVEVVVKCLSDPGLLAQLRAIIMPQGGLT